MAAVQDPVYNQKIQAALVAVEEAEAAPQVTDQVTLSSGVVLRFKKIPLMRINAIVEQFPYPPVPEIYDAEKGRSEKNPLSEVYLQMKQEVDAQRASAVVDAVVATGTILEHRPDTVPPVESDDWIEELEVSHIEVRTESKLARYLAWVKFVAIIDTADLQKIAKEFGISLGVSESQIAAAVDNNFPNN